MVTIGDSFAVVAILGGICLSAWALMISVALVFPSKAVNARKRIAAKPWASFFTGMALWLTLGILGFGMVANPLPLAKLMGWTVVMSLLSVASVGASGLVLLASERLRALAPEMTSYSSIAKSAAVIVTAGLVPLLGWFLVVPFLVFASTGAGLSALMQRSEATNEAPRFIP
ncbi:MAG: hypothetical protein BGO01_20935 [Armatimonadetes bacterium 55-13]|nr:hypothetical protein [Armatimonadota bacterium]ODU54158.1 MAG: hypothetical protein ABT09_00040 [bacterium SCN 57-13]OJU64577.1 MAG: hypothetical protein BGO01_20935 [Armatimonadetes bacterium 55-13]